MEITSPNPGPTVWLTACMHGDEVGGVVVIQEIFKRLKKHPLLRGSLHSFPLINPLGFETSTRHTIQSKEDINRSFPGNEKGSLAERIALKIFQTIVKTNPQLVLDLHNDWRESLPYTVIDPYPGKKLGEVYDRVKLYGKKAGLLLIQETKDSVDSILYHQTLSGSLIYHSIPALTLELGESFVVNEYNVEAGVNSIWQVLNFLEMVHPHPKKEVYPLPREFRGKVLRYTHEPFSSSSGIIRFLQKPAEVVHKGQPVAKIYNVFGKLLETIRAPQEGIVLGHSDTSVAFPGVPVMAFGIFKEKKPLSTMGPEIKEKPEDPTGLTTEPSKNL